jgi:hypothetical protein
VFFEAPGGNFDLASFSFQVPIFGLAKATATTHRARVNIIVFVFISLLIEANVLTDPAWVILVAHGGFGNTQFSRNIDFFSIRLNVLRRNLFHT